MGVNRGVVLCGINRNTQKRTSHLEIMYLIWFPKGQKTHLGKFTKKWFGFYRIQLYSQMTLCFWFL
jgi:hypothetical protein